MTLRSHYEHPRVIVIDQATHKTHGFLTNKDHTRLNKQCLFVEQLCCLLVAFSLFVESLLFVKSPFRCLLSSFAVCWVAFSCLLSGLFGVITPWRTRAPRVLAPWYARAPALSSPMIKKYGWRIDSYVGSKLFLVIPALTPRSCLDVRQITYFSDAFHFFLDAFHYF